MTIALILANVVVFAFMWPLNDQPNALFDVYRDYALFPARVTSGSGFETMIASAFLHGGFLHLAGNMLFLWIFGDNLEDQFGHIGFAIFYVLAAILAGAAHVFSDPGSTVPVIGASGAVAGVMGGYLLLFPRSRVDVFFFFLVFFRIFSIPAWIVLGLWFGLQLFNGTAINAGAGGVAYWAHAGGFIAGFILTLPFWIRRGATAFWRDEEGHPPHPEATYKISRSSIPIVRRSK